MNPKDKAADAAATAWTIFRSADAEGRDLSRRERARVEELLDEAERLKAQAQTDAEIRGVTEAIGPPEDGISMKRPERGGRLGMDAARQVDQPEGRQDQGRDPTRRLAPRQGRHLARG